MLTAVSVLMLGLLVLPTAARALTTEQKLRAADGVSGELFGYSVALEGDTAVVGARDAFTGFKGAAYVFERSGGVWGQVAKLTASDGAAGDRVGGSVAISGDTIVARLRPDATSVWPDDHNRPVQLSHGIIARRTASEVSSPLPRSRAGRTAAGRQGHACTGTC